MCLFIEWLLLKQPEKSEVRNMGKINIQSRDLVTALHMCFVKQIGKRLDIFFNWRLIFVFFYYFFWNNSILFLTNVLDTLVPTLYVFLAPKAKMKQSYNQDGEYFMVTVFNFFLLEFCILFGNFFLYKRTNLWYRGDLIWDILRMSVM